MFVSVETSHCQLFYSLTGGTLGMNALAQSWPWGLCKYAFPPVNLLAQTLCKIREDEKQVLLVAPYCPTHFQNEIHTLAPDLNRGMTASMDRVDIKAHLDGTG